MIQAVCKAQPHLNPLCTSNTCSALSHAVHPQPRIPSCARPEPRTPGRASSAPRTALTSPLLLDTLGYFPMQFAGAGEQPAAPARSRQDGPGGCARSVPRRPRVLCKGYGPSANPLGSRRGAAAQGACSAIIPPPGYRQR